eukprot:11181925-Lingulodinium_polyedra.AAC.1
MPWRGPPSIYMLLTYMLDPAHTHIISRLSLGLLALVTGGDPPNFQPILAPPSSLLAMDSSSASATTPKRRRQMSSKKVQGFGDQMGDNAQARQLRSIYEENCAAMKGNPNLIWAVSDLIHAQKEKAAMKIEKPLNRSIRFVIGTNKSNGLPRYILREGAAILTGCDQSRVETWQEADEEAAHLVLWGTAAVPGQALPSLKMMPSQVLKWFKTLAEGNFNVIKGCRPGRNGEFDWQTKVGAFSLVCDEGQCKGVKFNRTGSIKELDDRFQCLESEI